MDDNTGRPLMWPRSFKGTVLELSLRELILVGVTVLVSVLYKLIINSGLFGLIGDQMLCRIIFCGTELLLLGMYWHYTYIFSEICRRRTNSLKECYLWTSIVFFIFCVIYWGSYFVMSRELFLWVFRVTVNLIGLRMLTYAPDNLVPYMVAYNLGMFLIMFLEPVIGYLRWRSWMKREEQQKQ